MSASTVDISPIISETAARIKDLASQANNLASNALSATGSGSNLPAFVAQNVKLRGTVPTFQGNLDLSQLLLSSYNNALGDIRPQFASGLSSYLAKWFPDCIVSTTNNWICDTILNGGTGLPPNIENAIWERARSREVIDARRLEQEALTQLSSRGFMIPPGVTTARLLAIQQDVADKSSTIARDTAIKHIDLIIENVKFAVSEGIKVRIATISNLSEFVKAYLLPEELALEKAKAIVSARTALISSAADYYRAMISEAELGIRVQEISATSQNNRLSSLVSENATLASTRARVAEGLAESYGTAAAGAASGIITIAQSSINSVSA